MIGKVQWNPFAVHFVAIHSHLQDILLKLTWKRDQGNADTKDLVQFCFGTGS